MRKPLQVDTSQLQDIAKKAEDKQASASAKGGKLLGTSKTLSASSEKWKVPVLKDGFDLDHAKELAFRTAKMYMNDILNYDNLQVDLEWQTEEPVGHVKDLNTGKVINSYQGVDMLKLYAQNKKERGVIVDGRV